EVIEPQLAELARELGMEPRMRVRGRPPALSAVELARTLRLAERLDERTADAHRLADRLHLRPERRVRAGKLLEGEARELDDDVGGRIAERVKGLVAERHLRRDRDRVARVHAHRVDVLDRADDDDVVLAVAHDLELELVPAEDGFLDEHLADGALGKPELDLA